MRIGAFQFDVGLDEVAANRRAVEEGLREAAAQGYGLVVLPEMWPTSFVTNTGPQLERAVADSLAAVDWLVALSGELSMVVCGTAFCRPDPAAAPTNRLHICDQGRLALSYDKVHLFSPTAEHETFLAGRQAPGTAETSAGRISGVICYDLRFGDITRVPTGDGVQIMVCPAQWPSPRAAHWRALAIGRAVENQCFVVACNRSGASLIGSQKQRLEFPGNSIVVDPHGTVLAEGEGSSGLLGAEVDLAVVAELRARIPIAADRRPGLYGQWGSDS
ncbi:MAG: carbon-nitrogen family hydrolase [Deltaproteobacteria bacterium]|nr:carbon-nitrogen family hydrolase [Deltaproteobacteria bacterium]